MARATKSKRNYKNKFKFVWTKELIFLLIGLGVCIALMIFCLIPTRQQKFYSKWHSDSNNLETTNVFEEISYKSLKKKIDNGERVYVYYASEKDSTSVTNIGTLDYYTNKHEKENEATHFSVDKIYVYNAKEAYELDKDDEKAVAKFDEKEEYFNSLRDVDKNTGLAIEEISLETYSQLWIFDSGRLVYSSETISSDEQASDQGVNFRTTCVRFLSYYLTSDDAKNQY